MKTGQVRSRAALARSLAFRVSRDPVLRRLRDLAAEEQVPLWLVGGAVRDAALGEPGGDHDLVAGRGIGRLVPRIQQALDTRGFRVRKGGITTWRFARGASGVDLVDASRRGLERDLLRRELTVNAIAYELAGGRVEDPLDGLADLRAGRLRMPEERVFADDPVRALRLARFIARYPQMRIHRPTRAAAAAVAPRLRRASVERIRDELDKLLQASAPHRGLEEIQRLDLLRWILPELVPMLGCSAGFDRPDVWTHTLMTLERTTRAGRFPGAATLGQNDGLRVLRWSLLLHDMAKPSTYAMNPEGKPSFHGHEVLGSEQADALLNRLRLPRKIRSRITRLVRLHLRPGHLADAGPTARGLGRLAREAGDDLRLLMVHAACDARASGTGALGRKQDLRRWRRLRDVLQRLADVGRRQPAASAPPLLDGAAVMRLLGLEPGPAVGEALEELGQARAAGLIETPEAARRHLLERFEVDGNRQG